MTTATTQAFADPRLHCEAWPLLCGAQCPEPVAFQRTVRYQVAGVGQGLHYRYLCAEHKDMALPR